MKLVVRLAIYLVLLVLAGITFSKFRAAYQTGPTRVIESVEADKAPAPSPAPKRCARSSKPAPALRCRPA